MRDWFYYRARSRHRATVSAGSRCPGQTVIVIGDAAKAGKSKEAIASAFEAALLGNQLTVIPGTRGTSAFTRVSTR